MCPTGHAFDRQGGAGLGTLLGIPIVEEEEEEEGGLPHVEAVQALPCLGTVPSHLCHYCLSLTLTALGFAFVTFSRPIAFPMPCILGIIPLTRGGSSWNFGKCLGYTPSLAVAEGEGVASEIEIKVTHNILGWLDFIFILLGPRGGG